EASLYMHSRTPVKQERHYSVRLRRLGDFDETAALAHQAGKCEADEQIDRDAEHQEQPKLVKGTPGAVSMAAPSIHAAECTDRTHPFALHSSNPSKNTDTGSAPECFATCRALVARVVRLSGFTACASMTSPRCSAVRASSESPGFSIPRYASIGGP